MMLILYRMETAYTRILRCQDFFIYPDLSTPKLFFGVPTFLVGKLFFGVRLLAWRTPRHRHGISALR
jgi:hypothetical protein